MTVVTGLFQNRFDAEKALRQIEALGIREDRISLVMTDQTRANHFKLEEGNKVDEGVATGATFGGVTGAVLGAVLSAGVIAIPGLNLVITGALAAGLAGLGAGAAVGGFLGGLIGAGIPEHEAKLYEKEIQRGNVLLAITVENSDEKQKVKGVLESLHAMNIAA